MSKCISYQNGPNVGIICLVDTDFKCPACGIGYKESEYYNQLNKSKRGFIYKRCKQCATRIGISTDFKGDVQVWLKSDENDLITLK
jgi:uncharacterized C2H2 Zn-finger protein